jgi:hypothetical protein
LPFAGKIITIYLSAIGLHLATSLLCSKFKHCITDILIQGEDMFGQASFLIILGSLLLMRAGGVLLPDWLFTLQQKLIVPERCFWCSCWWVNKIIALTDGIKF